MKKKSAFRIDDDMARQIEAYQQDLEPFVGKESLHAAIAAVPYVGSVILPITNDVATRRPAILCFSVDPSRNSMAIKV